MSDLITNDPIALHYLMSETLFQTLDSEPSLSEAKGQIGYMVSDLDVKQEQFVYQGNKESDLLFILRNEEFPYFSTGALDAFEKVLTAVQKRKEEVAVVNLSHAYNPNDFKMMMDFFNPQKIILLGIDPISLKLPAIPHNTFMKGRSAIVFNTFTFEEMFEDQSKKRVFWEKFRALIKI